MDLEDGLAVLEPDHVDPGQAGQHLAHALWVLHDRWVEIR